jgi:hypothetical protein
LRKEEGSLLSMTIFTYPSSNGLKNSVSAAVALRKEAPLEWFADRLKLS